MPTDLETKAFQKSMEKVTARWAKKVHKALTDLEKVKKAQEALRDKGVLTPEEQTKLTKLEALEKKLRKDVQSANDSLRIEVMILTPPPEADARALTKSVTPLFEKVKKGLPLGKDITLKPKVDVDLKKRKFKKFELELTWRF